ncbi:MAG: transaldolase family protein [Caldilineales bacterium]|nr:transaldolase family protein [Caldilineales bacterium]MCW5859343.1 transaldolase family protein [Caldilineales bacterium]
MTSQSPLQRTVATTPTDYWNDSCSMAELTYAIGHGAVGATTNPAIVLSVLNKEMHLWRGRIAEIIAENPTWSEAEVTWKLIEEMAVRGARLLLPIWEQHEGRKGRLSIQTNPMFYRNWEAIVAQARHFQALAPNMQVKIPVTKAGVRAIEEATYHGVSVNATVCFTAPQAVAVAEAMERGLDRRAAEGEDINHMAPVCTIMIGRTDDWMKVLANRQGFAYDRSSLDWAGIAVFKNAYRLWGERGYRTRLLAAAYRHLGHWSELIGGDIVLTIPYEWQLKINASDIPVISRIENPVAAPIVAALYDSIPDFRRAYDPDGMSVAEFDGYGATVRTLRAFIAAAHDLMAVVREFMLPNPD